MRTRGLDKPPLGDLVGQPWAQPMPAPISMISTAIASDSHRLFALNESEEALAGLWHALDVFWVNDPTKDHVAHRKVAQLRLAQQVDLRLPGQPAPFVLATPHHSTA
jgi:hypothetical protein